MSFTTRFAPSPTGPLHLGHAYSAILAFDMAQANSGRFLLRIEDIDRSRARPVWEAQIGDDLAWLGLNWPEPVMRQSDRMKAYRAALHQLWDRGLLYVCTCNRRDIAKAANAPQAGSQPSIGPDGTIYPGTCRPDIPKLPTQLPNNSVLRLNLNAMSDLAALSFHETGSGTDGARDNIAVSMSEAIRSIGDVVLARRDMGTSYHLAVVVDDAAQGISHVVRGQDLFEATKIHVILQHLLGLPTPVYHHHRLICDEAGKRLAKRDDARAIAKYRGDGATLADIRAMLGL